MSKADTLLKRATFFERMALYSDRKAFLQSLAQTGGASGEWPAAKELPADVAQGINSVMKDLAATKPESSAQLQNRLQSFYEGTNQDMGQLAQALSEAANTIPGDHTGQVQRALDLANRVRQMVEQPQQSEPANETMVMPTDRITAFPPIDKGQQEALARFLTINGITFVDPKKLNDGKLGPETRKGLNAFKQWYNAKATGKKITSDAEALQLVKYIVDNDAKYRG